MFLNYNGQTKTTAVLAYRKPDYKAAVPAEYLDNKTHDGGENLVIDEEIYHNWLINNPMTAQSIRDKYEPLGVQMKNIWE